MSFSCLWCLWLWGLRCLLLELRLKAACQQQSPYSVQLMRAIFPPSITLLLEPLGSKQQALRQAQPHALPLKLFAA